MNTLLAIASGAIFLVGAFFAWRIRRALLTRVTWATSHPNIRYQRGAERLLYWTMIGLDAATSLICFGFALFIALFLLFPECSANPIIQNVLAC